MFIRKILRFIGHLEWLRFGVRDRIIRFWRPYALEQEKFNVPFFGGIYIGDFNSYLDWNVYYYGAYAKEELKLIDDFLKTFNKPVFLDIGANVGHHTLFAAMRSEKVIAFEPLLSLSKQLEEKILSNKLTNIVLFKCALGNENVIATYVKPAGNNLGTGTFLKSEYEGEGEKVNLPIKIGDEVLLKHDLTDIQFIKIDTEGFEPHVLKGLKITLDNCRPIIFFEWTQGERKLVKQTCPELFPNNYQFYQFISDTVTFGIFRKPTYCLFHLKDSWPDGNLLAVPQEYIDHLNRQEYKLFAEKHLVKNS